MRTASICPECAIYTNAKCIIYDGDYLSAIGVSPLDSLNDILVKINDAIANGCITTTTSTTESSTTTTTTESPTTTTSTTNLT